MSGRSETKTPATRRRGSSAPGWSDLAWIRGKLNKKWDSGAVLGSLLRAQDGLFPITIPLIRPCSRDISENFAGVSAWIKALRDESKPAAGAGYELLWKEISHRQSGKNSIPAYAVIPTAGDALHLLKKKREADAFVGLARTVLDEMPVLGEWMRKYPFKALNYYGDWAGILETLRWFSRNPGCGLYLRQLDIPGVDTKFIERRKGILTELLNIVLPEGGFDAGADTFETRFGLRVRPARARLRFLDKKLYICGLSDMAIPVEQLAALRPPVSRLFITENEINGLCFPDARESAVIFGLGYGVDMLKAVEWLSGIDVFYWGDIDTHGFAMLDLVRSFLPRAQSMLMGEDILLGARALWSEEERPFAGGLTRLTSDEYGVFRSLRDDVYGKNVRLEQERISYRLVQNAVEGCV